MKKFNITTQRSYEKNGETKKTYPNVGRMTYFPASQDKEEGYILELNMYPNTKFYVFEDKPKDQQDTRPAQRTARPASTETDPDNIDYGDANINPDDIPF